MLVGQPQLGGDRAHLVLEQHPQRLDQVEAEVLGQPADVVVGLDRRRGVAVAARLDHVRVERALDQEAGVLELGGLLLEDPDELLADDLALALGLVDPVEPVEEAARSRRRGRAGRRGARGMPRPPASASFFRIIPWSTSTQVSWSPTARWTSAAAVAESTPPERPQITRGVADLRADPLDLLVDHRGRRPALLAAGDVAQEALEDLRAVRGVDDLGVELDPVEPALGALEGGDRRAGARREGREAGRRLEDRVAVAHPALLLGRAARRAARPRRRPSVSSVRPNSPASAPSTRPPRTWTIACMP